MRVSLNWLKEFVEIDQTPAELAEMLTMAGLEVEGLEHKAHTISNPILELIGFPSVR